MSLWSKQNRFKEFRPTRTLLQFLVDRIIQRRDTDYNLIQNQLASLFVKQSDVETTIVGIHEILTDGFELDRTELYLRKGGEYYWIRGEQQTHVDTNDELFQHLQSHPAEKLYFHEQGSKQSHKGLDEYFEKHNIVYVMPLIYEHRLFGWVTMHHRRSSYRLFANDRNFLEHIQPLIAIGLRRARIDQKLTGRIEELEMLHRISQTMNSSLSAKETLESVMDAVIELTHGNRALMYLMDEDRKHFIPTIGRGITEDISLDFKVEVKKSLFRFIVDSRQPMVIEDAENDERVNKEYAAKVKTKSFVVVPMVVKEQVIGVIGVDNKDSKRPITSINVELLMTLANHAAIALSNSQLYEQTQQFNENLQKKVKEATDHLERLLDMKSHFLTVASHQLRTPTTIVRGLLSMIVEDPKMKREEILKFVEQCFTTINRLERIISELLSATELEDDSVLPYVEEIVVTDVIDDIVTNLQPLADKKNIELKTVYPKNGLPLLYSDRFKLSEALSNLVDNAIRYTQKGSVTISVRSEQNEIVFEVVDTGIGMTLEDKKVIFDKFRRGKDVAKIEPDGSGLGLFIAKRISGLVQGDISVDSKGSNKGSTFIFRVPIKISQAGD